MRPVGRRQNAHESSRALTVGHYAKKCARIKEGPEEDAPFPSRDYVDF